MGRAPAGVATFFSGCDLVCYLPPMSDPEPTEPTDTDPADIADDGLLAEAFETMLPRIEAIPKEALVRITTDRQKAAIAAMAIGRFVMQEEVKTRFDSLPEKEFDHSVVPDLKVSGQACWHVEMMLKSAQARGSEAKLAPSLVKAATARKERMIKLVKYHLGDHPEDGAEVKAIQEGTGYIDLASDLTRLASLYRSHKTVVKADTKHYRPDDQAAAEAQAGEIVVQLGEAQKQAEILWNDRARRAFTLLTQIYSEVAAAGHWLFRHDDGDERFPSLYTAGRSGRGRGKKRPEASAAPAQPPAEDNPDHRDPE